MKHYTPRPLRRVVIERMASGAPPLPRALFEVARALGDWRPDAPLRYAGDPPRRSGITEETLGAYLAEVERAWDAHGADVFCLADAPASPQLALFLNVEETPSGRVESLWFSLPADLSGPPFELERVMRLLATTCQSFGAHHGAVEDSLLLLLYRGRRAAERARASLPPDQRQYVPDVPPIEGAAGELPSLLVPQEFDRRRVPDAVWWVNFLDRVQVATLTPERVNAAGWLRGVELEGGGRVLAATEGPTDVTDAAHMERLRRIVEGLNLYELQRQHRYEE